MNTNLEKLKRVLKVSQEVLFSPKEHPHSEEKKVQNGQSEQILETHTAKQEPVSAGSPLIRENQERSVFQAETESVPQPSGYSPLQERVGEQGAEEMRSDRPELLPTAHEKAQVQTMPGDMESGAKLIQTAEAEDLLQNSDGQNVQKNLSGYPDYSGYRGGVYPGFDKPGGQRGDLQDVEEIDLLDLFSFYMSRLPLLIGAVLIGALCAGLFTHYCIPDKFTAVSRMYMISASSDSVINLSDLNLGTSLSNDYVELMKSRPVLEEVINTLNLEYTYEELRNMIDLGVVTGTRIVKISTTSTDPYEAMIISNEIARVSKVQLPKVMDAPAPTIVEEAIVPKYKSSPSLKRNTVVGALALLACVLAILTVKYLLDDTIKTSEDVEKEFGVMPLTVIPEGTIKGLKKVEDTDKKSRFWYYKKSKKKKKKKKKSGKGNGEK